MQWYHAVIILLAVFAYGAAHGEKQADTKRFRLWVMLIAGAYVVSVAYAHAVVFAWFWTPPVVAIAFMADAVAYKIIDETHEKAVEKNGPRLAMAVSASANALQLTALLFGFPPALPMWLHGSLLELLTALAFLWIGGHGILMRVRRGGNHGFDFLGRRGGYLASVAVSLCEKGERKTNVSQPLRKWR